MKLQFMSDLHNEFSAYQWNIPPTDCDLIILAGDIGTGLRGVEWAIRQSEALKKPVVYVFGNHEYYHQEASILIEQAVEYAKDTDVIILEKDVLNYEDYDIIGTTLWTDYLLYGEPMQAVAMQAADDFMSDHKLISYKGELWTPEDALEEHQKCLYWLKGALQTTRKKIVVTHHAPTFHAGHPQYRGDMCTPAFCSDLEGLIIEWKPLVWISGHSHYCYKREIGDTLCISNTKGYPNEGLLHFDPELIVEV